MKCFTIPHEKWADGSECLISVYGFNTEEEREAFLQELTPSWAFQQYPQKTNRSERRDYREFEDYIRSVPFPVAVMFIKGREKEDDNSCIGRCSLLEYPVRLVQAEPASRKGA